MPVRGGSAEGHRDHSRAQACSDRGHSPAERSTDEERATDGGACHDSAVEYVWLALAVAVMAGLAWVGFRIEPHWVAKDHSRFLCNAQLMTERGDPVGRFKETKILVEPNFNL